jgi:hypothetical protein
MGDWVQRRLAASLAADVVGYPHIMEINEVGTLAGSLSPSHATATSRISVFQSPCMV